ncbi:MAG: hypothetical protein JO069_10185, partial [Verrucomicrobia bacterium]|nr:hypothetical protein [Verrucomicrobiota bacterium]
MVTFGLRLLLALWLFVVPCAGLFFACSLNTAAGRDYLPWADRTAILTDRGLQHIKERHWPTSTAPGAGKFADGITDQDLRELISEAVAKGRVRRNSHGRPG